MVSFRKQPARSVGSYCGRYATEICRKWTSHLPSNDTIVQRKVESKGKGKVSIHFSADPDTVDAIYRIILSVNQLSIYGAVAAICNEYDDQPDSTGEPVIVEGQSIVLWKIKAEVPAQDKGLEDAKIIMQKYFQQVNSLSPENRLNKFCKEAGFMSVVEVGLFRDKKC